MADLSILREVGMSIDALSPEELDALNTLDDSEIAALASIRQKLNGGGEVEGFAFRPGAATLRPAPGALADGGLIW